MATKDELRLSMGKVADWNGKPGLLKFTMNGEPQSLMVTPFASKMQVGHRCVHFEWHMTHFWHSLVLPAACDSAASPVAAVPTGRYSCATCAAVRSIHATLGKLRDRTRRRHRRHADSGSRRKSASNHAKHTTYARIPQLNQFGNKAGN